MTTGLHRHQRGARWLVLCIAVMALFAIGITAQEAPVTISVALSGDQVPGGAVTATANVTISDGSTLQSIMWEQVAGADATLSTTTGDSVTVTLPGNEAVKAELIHLLESPPHLTGPLPGNAPVPDPFYGGLQSDRFGVVGVNHLALEEAGAVVLEVTATTSSGSYTQTVAIHSEMMFTVSPGLRNVAIEVPVLLHGKEQDSYDWALTAPSGSSAMLMDATTANPFFTPDVAGTYVVTVTDVEAGEAKQIEIKAGTWKGVITGQDELGLPIADASCTGCHTQGSAIDKFTPWKQSGHAHILTQNVNNPNGHYSTNCVGCHTVGYNPAADNNGIDDSADWAALVASGILSHGDENNWATILQTYPESARKMNIQCENCHGPQDSAAHPDNANAFRTNLSSEVCASCHGEPLRHARYQQWQLSAHANYQTARDEGTRGGCAKCHTANGFIEWQKIGFEGDPEVTWTNDEIHPQTCATCHDTHFVGTSSGGPHTDANMRIEGTTPMLMSGYKVEDAGKAALCMTCHNGRRGLKDDDNFSLSDASRAPHSGPQTDMLMGRNLFFTDTPSPGLHAAVEDSCVTCHMEATPPPADLSYNLGGTNHVFYASKEVCANCHSSIVAEDVQVEVETKLEALKEEIELALFNTMRSQLLRGNTISFDGTEVSGSDAISAVHLTESHGRQAVDVDLSTGEHISHITMNSITFNTPGGTEQDFFAVADPAISKAGWNYFSIHADGSHGVHNPGFINSALDVTMYAIETYNETGGEGNPELGGGLGNGAGAVACTTPYVYWIEIAGHIPGQAGSQWRTDLVARNLSSNDASLQFYLHEAGGTLQGGGTVDGSSQMVFEDVVGAMGGTSNLGALEICSDRPLLTQARIFNQGEEGTFGQGFKGQVADLGFDAGETFSLIGLREQVDVYRTNLSITNAGTTDAEVAVTLYDAIGTALTSYTIAVPPGIVIQDGSPFATRANAANVGWGYAVLTVVSGNNVYASGSVVDMVTNDPTTISPRQ